MNFSEKLKIRDKELSNVTQAIEKQVFAKNPMFIEYSKANNIYQENEELLSLISDQEETLQLLNAELDLFYIIMTNKIKSHFIK